MSLWRTIQKNTRLQVSDTKNSVLALKCRKVDGIESNSCMGDALQIFKYEVLSIIYLFCTVLDGFLGRVFFEMLWVSKLRILELLQRSK